MNKKKICVIVICAVLLIGILLLVDKSSKSKDSSKRPTEKKEKADSVDSVDDSLHLTFKGIPINGSLDRFTDKLKQAGFKRYDEIDFRFEDKKNDGGFKTLCGDFAGYKSCVVQVYTLKSKDLVSTIKAFFPEREKWSELEQDYNSLRKLLKQKYGEPAQVVEKFEQTPYSLSYSDKMIRLKNDECTYFSKWSTEKGDIVLKLSSHSISCFVVLTYYDKLNSDKVQSNAIRDL